MLGWVTLATNVYHGNTHGNPYTSVASMPSVEYIEGWGGCWCWWLPAWGFSKKNIDPRDGDAGSLLIGFTICTSPENSLQREHTDMDHH